MGTSCEDFGKLFGRLCVSVLLLFHGYHFLYGMTNVDARIVALGLPAVVGDAGQWIGEIIAPLLVILGIYARLGGLVIFVYLLVAILISHTFAPNAHLLLMNDPRAPDTIGDGYRLELQFFFLIGGLNVFLLGAGKYALKIGGKWNQ